MKLAGCALFTWGPDVDKYVDNTELIMHIGGTPRLAGGYAQASFLGPYEGHLPSPEKMGEGGERGG